MKVKEQLKILQAFKEGKKIQRIPAGGIGYYTWEDISGDHQFDFNHFEYRIKPKVTHRAYSVAELESDSSGMIPAVKEISTGIIYTIAAIDGTDVYILQKDGSTKRFSTIEMLDLFTWRDGEVFGVKNDGVVKMAGIEKQ